MYCIVLTGPTGDHDSLRRGGPGGAWPGLHFGAAPLQESTPTQLELDLRFLVPRGTGQQHTYQGHHTRDTRDEDDEEDAWNRMKSMRGTG